MNQLFCLIEFTITGALIGLLFDIFRILRKSFRTSDWITTIQDILFWIIAGLIILFSIFTFNNGEIRGYVFFGIALGIFIYIFTISRYIIKYTVVIINFFKKILSYPIKLIKFLIISPVRHFVKKIYCFLEKLFENMTKKYKNREKIQ